MLGTRYRRFTALSKGGTPHFRAVGHCTALHSAAQLPTARQRGSENQELLMFSDPRCRAVGNCAALCSAVQCPTAQKVWVPLLTAPVKRL